MGTDSLPHLRVSRETAESRLTELIKSGQLLIPEPLVNVIEVANKMETGERRWSSFVEASLVTIFEGGGPVSEFGGAGSIPIMRPSRRARRGYFQSPVSGILRRISERVAVLRSLRDRLPLFQEMRDDSARSGGGPDRVLSSTSTRTVFLSSTTQDLKECRDAVSHRIQQLDHYQCIRMEDFCARDDTPDEFCRGQAAACDVFVGVVGHLYGSCPPGLDESFTEREYNAACEARRPRLVFIAAEDLLPSASLQETADKVRKQRAFRNRVSSKRIRESFRSPEGLASAVVIALHNWERSPER